MTSTRIFSLQHTSIFLGGIAAITWLLRDIEAGISAKKAHQRLGGHQYARCHYPFCMPLSRVYLLALVRRSCVLPFAISTECNASA